MNKSWTLAVTAGLAMVMLGGCSTGQVGNGRDPGAVLSQETLAEVKIVVKEIELEIAGHVPDSVRLGIREKTQGALTECAPGGAVWGSSTVVDVSEQPDLGALEARLRADWPRAPDFDFELTRGSTDEPRLVLRSPELGNYWVQRREDVLQVASFSTCFDYDEERDGYDWEIGAE
jgi:hypothetical protein